MLPLLLAGLCLPPLAASRPTAGASVRPSTAPGYTITDLGNPTDSDVHEPLAISESGQVAGYHITSAGQLRPFVSQAGTLSHPLAGTELETFSAFASGITTAGHLVGGFRGQNAEGGFITRAFVKKGNEVTYLPDLGANTSQANAINNNGQVAGPCGRGPGDGVSGSGGAVRGRPVRARTWS